MEKEIIKKLVEMLVEEYNSDSLARSMAIDLGDSEECEYLQARIDVVFKLLNRLSKMGVIELNGSCKYDYGCLYQVYQASMKQKATRRNTK